jgi:NAD(P)-dependent dehydrogenase (short-subunit alcohol dehydrogenase family)
MSDGIHGQGCSGPLAGGIGRGSALDFARRGAKVVVVDLDPTEREASAELVRSTVARAVRSRGRHEIGRCAELHQATLDAYGAIDCFFNNAGALKAPYPDLLFRHHWWGRRGSLDPD